MQELYASLILHENSQPINEENVKKILSSAGANVDDAKIKALVASLSGVNIDEALKEAVSFATQPTTAPVEKKEEEKEEDTEKAAEQASAGLSSLFG